MKFELTDDKGNKTGVTGELTIIDPVSGCDWIGDLLGNHDADMVYDEENEVYLMGEDDFKWWEALTKNLEEAEHRKHELQKEMSWEERENFKKAIVEKAGYGDLEDIPGRIHEICDKFEK